MDPRFHVYEIDVNGKIEPPSRQDSGPAPFDPAGYEDPDDAERAIIEHGKHETRYTILPVYSIYR